MCKKGSYPIQLDEYSSYSYLIKGKKKNIDSNKSLIKKIFVIIFLLIL